MDNLELYNRVRTVPTDACKPFTSGTFSGTDINPMWRIKTLTENFGMAGIGWYIDEVAHWTEPVNGELCTYVKIHLFVKVDGEWSKPIVGIGGSREFAVFRNTTKVSDECYKMAYTDAISVACKALGFGADIYWQNDPTKYTMEADNGKKNGNSGASTDKAVNSPKAAITALKKAQNKAELNSIWASLPAELQNNPTVCATANEVFNAVP